MLVPKEYNTNFIAFMFGFSTLQATTDTNFWYRVTCGVVAGVTGFLFVYLTSKNSRKHNEFWDHSARK